MRTPVEMQTPIKTSGSYLLCSAPIPSFRHCLQPLTSPEEVDSRSCRTSQTTLHFNSQAGTCQVMMTSTAQVQFPSPCSSKATQLDLATMIKVEPFSAGIQLTRLIALNGTLRLIICNIRLRLTTRMITLFATLTKTVNTSANKSSTST